MLFCSLSQIKIFGTINGSNNDLLLLDIAKNNIHSTNQSKKSNNTQITVAGGIDWEMEAKREEGGNRLRESHKVGVEVGDIETRTRVTERVGKREMWRAREKGIPDARKVREARVGSFFSIAESDIPHIKYCHCGLGEEYDFPWRGHRNSESSLSLCQRKCKFSNKIFPRKVMHRTTDLSFVKEQALLFYGKGAAQTCLENDGFSLQHMKFGAV